MAFLGSDIASGSLSPLKIGNAQGCGDLKLRSALFDLRRGALQRALAMEILAIVRVRYVTTCRSFPAWPRRAELPNDRNACSAPRRGRFILRLLLRPLLEDRNASVDDVNASAAGAKGWARSPSHDQMLDAAFGRSMSLY